MHKLFDRDLSFYLQLKYNRTVDRKKLDFVLISNRRKTSTKCLPAIDAEYCAFMKTDSDFILPAIVYFDSTFILCKKIKMKKKKIEQK